VGIRAMSNLDAMDALHVYPSRAAALVGLMSHGEPVGAYVGGPPLRGIHAEMLYIHGSARHWEEPRAHAWLTENAMTRLVDANPARIVWVGDP
jgi:hypothetical protein